MIEHAEHSSEMNPRIIEISENQAQIGEKERADCNAFINIVGRNAVLKQFQSFLEMMKGFQFSLFRLSIPQ